MDGRELVLEIVAIVHDDILFSAFGNSKFVDIINHFNHQVYTDELTGVYNRRYLDEQFCVLSEQARQLHTSFSVVMADIDSFKSINDQYGHQEGDAILQCVAETLQSHFSKDRGDVVSRYGGDEFVVLIRGIQKPVLEERIHHLQKALSEKERPVSLSIGVFHVPLMKEKVSDKEMLKKADEALYSVKNRGKGAYCILEDK